jgi:hypothetical protein
MESDNLIAPRARSRNLVEREIDGELIIFDRTSNIGHRLTREVAATWKRCDGLTTVQEIAGDSGVESGHPVSEEAVWRHLIELGEINLLEEAASKPAARNRYSRKSMLIKLGAAGAIGVGLPLIRSIPAAAVTPCDLAGNTCPSGCNSQCTSSKCPSCNPQKKCDQGNNGNPC